MVGSGIKLPLEIFHTGTPSGWGVRCPRSIAVGAFVACYIGSIIDERLAVRGPRPCLSGPSTALSGSLTMYASLCLGCVIVVTCVVHECSLLSRSTGLSLLQCVARHESAHVDIHGRQLPAILDLALLKVSPA